MHFDRGDAEAGQPPELVGDARTHGRGDLRQVEPVLDDDVEVDPQAVRRARDVDALRQLVARQEACQTLAGHADDAVALGGGVTDDLRDRVGRDPDRTELGLLRKVTLHATLDAARSRSVASPALLTRAAAGAEPAGRARRLSGPCRP